MRYIQYVWLALFLPSISLAAVDLDVDKNGATDINRGGSNATTATGARSNLGLGNVTNTSDANKPVSTAQQSALDLKSNITCFADATAFNACFALDWPTGGGISAWSDVQALITGTGDYIKYDGTRGTPTGSTYTAGTSISITDGVIASTVTLADLWDLDYNDLINAPTGGSMTWPSTAGIPTWSSGTSWGTSLTLDTDMSSVSTSDDSVGSAKAIKAALDAKANSTNISFVAGALSDMKILTTEQPSTGENLIDDTVTYGATEDNLRLWSIDKVGSQLAGKIGTAGVTYEQLNTNGDVGTSAGTLAIGNHTHSGVYQPADADLDAWADISPTTGSINTTGAVQAKVPFNSYSAAQTLTASTHNSTIVQMTAAVEVTMWDCETANVGDTIMLWARDAEKIEVVPASGDHFNLFDGTALTAGNELDVAATAGTKVTLMCTADDTWSVYSETAASVDGGAAD